MLRQMEVKRSNLIKNKLTKIENTLENIKKQDKFNQRMIELGNLRRKLRGAKTLISIGKIIAKSPDLNYRTHYSRGLDNVLDKNKLFIVKSRAIQTIDSIIAKEVMKHYGIKRKY